MAEQTPEQVLEDIGAEVRRCTACRLCEGRTKAVPGEGANQERHHVYRRGAGVSRRPAGAAVCRPGGEAAGGDAGRRRFAAGAGVHYQRRQVPPAGQPRSPAGRNRRLQRLPRPPNCRHQPPHRRHARPLFHGAVLSPAPRFPPFTASRNTPTAVPTCRSTTPRPACAHTVIKHKLFEDIQRLPDVAKRLNELHAQGHFDSQETESEDASPATVEPDSDQLSLF